MSERDRHPAQPRATAFSSDHQQGGGRPGSAGVAAIPYAAKSVSTSAPTPLIERLCLLVLLALIPLRAVISETHTFEVPRLLRHVDVPEGAQPATTFALFAVVLAVTVLLAVVRFLRGANQPEAQARESQSSCRWTGIEIGAVVLAAAMLISTLRAGQKHLAIIGSLDFLGLLLYAVTLRHLLTRPWHLRLTLYVILAAGAMVVAKCAYQYWVETPDTIRYFEEHRDELVRPTAQEDAPGQAGFLYDYEQRLRSGAVSGYFAHPNVLGSYLILIVMTGLAVLAMRWSRGPRWSLVVPGIITLGAVVALAYSQSKGAMAGCAAAILVFVVGILWRRTWAARPGRAALLIWLAGLATAIAVVAVLNARPEALGKSMLFRHFYWRGAAAMVDAQDRLGIGAGNFGRHFTRYKDSACPEDVDDPHSWPVKAAVEWGALGLAGMLLVFAGITRRLCRNVQAGRVLDPRPIRNPQSTIRNPDKRTSPSGSIILWTAGIGVFVFTWWACLILGAERGYALLVLHLPALVWVAAFALGSLESSDKAFADDPPRLLLPALVGGMIGFILHTGVDLAMFQGGAATTFFAMMAVALAARDCDESISPLTAGARPPPRRDRRRVAAILVGAVGAATIAAVATLLILPATRLGALLRTARTTGAPARWDDYLASTGHGAYRDATDACQLDATAFGELLEQLTARVAAVDHVDAAIPLTDEMLSRDRDNSAVWHHRATLYYQRFVLGREVEDLRTAIAAMEQSIAAYPTSPNRRLILADLYERLAEATDSQDARTVAAKQLALALRLDDERIYISKPHRLTPIQRARIEERIARLTEEQQGM